MEFTNPDKLFVKLIIEKPIEAFGITKNRKKLENYLKYFFYHEITKETFNPNLSADELKILKIHTYCYLLDAKEYSEPKLMNCLNNVNLETLKNMLNEGEINKGEINENKIVLEQISEILQSQSLISALLNDWRYLECLVELYYSNLIKIYKALNRKIERIIVYEAPPFGKKHFFKEGNKSNYFTAFTFWKDSVLKNCIDKVWCSMVTKNIEINDRTISKSTKENIKKAIQSGIVYIDLTMIPLPLTSDIRKEWSTNKKYLFGNKQLPVLMLEWALEKLKLRFKEGGITNPFSPTCQIAIGTPINTSASIFEYYSNTLLKIDTDVYFDLAIVNSPEVFKKKPYLKGYTLKQFKFNVIDNISPTWRFVHNAFDFPK